MFLCIFNIFQLQSLQLNIYNASCLKFSICVMVWRNKKRIDIYIKKNWKLKMFIKSSKRVKTLKKKKNVKIFSYIKLTFGENLKYTFIRFFNFNKIWNPFNKNNLSNFKLSKNIFDFPVNFPFVFKVGKCKGNLYWIFKS